ncbi:unnamed protein product [Thelazia callipaeda]|uniref:SET domain-containing protein n=1 Tax=Thelazia callipaeda TaxID=103827 RepID=A0A0N5CYI1_THECL|nr:unnamed protein product [Thelazia callipaeda]
MSSANFMEWVIRHGGQNFGIDIRDCPNEGGKGLFATADFRENEVLVSIPDALVITAGSVADMEDMCEVFQRSEYPLLLKINHFRLKPFEALVYFFIAERQQNSKWFPYMQVLPTSFSTPAYLYPFLKSEDFPFKSRKQWYEQQQEISRMYRRFVAILGETTNWDKFLWAWHIVNTRCMYRNNKPHPLIDSSKGDTLAIVPLIDMLNHIKLLYESLNNHLIANRSVHKGDQVFVCYGSHSNELLWIEYGFRLERNICNKVEIPLGCLNFLFKLFDM